MTNSISPNNSTVFAGLGTSSFTIVTAGLYTCAFTSTIPYIAAGSSADSSVTTGGSDLTAVIKQDSTTLLTVDSPSPTQPSLGGSVSMLCDEGDVISLELTSSAAVDNARNAIKTTINLFFGGPA